MSNCRGCGTVLVEPTQDEVNHAVDNVLVASLEDAKKHGEICPLCGHSQAQPVSHRKSVQFGLLLALVLIATVIAFAYYMYRGTERESAARDALKEIQSNSQITQLLGTPLTIQGKIIGAVKQDETGWHEVKLSIPIHGPKGDGTAQISGGREHGPWSFTTLEVVMPKLQKKADLITGKIVEYSPDAYVDTHTEAVGTPESVSANVPAPQRDGGFPCVYAIAGPASAPQIGSCVTPTPMSKASRTPVDRFETDLRRGKFILRQTDLSISEAGFDIPLTRTYSSDDWLPNNKSHAFGLNANHQYDIAPLGTRNPYTEQFLVLEDGDFLYFPRVSKGTGYSDAVYRQSEVGNSFYKATQRWDGNGWLTELQDGSTIHFPESYSAKNLAQGAPTEMTDSAGNKIELKRDAKRNLQQLQAPDGASVKLVYDNSDRIVRAEDDQGLWTNYSYDSEGFLRDVFHSDATARHYSYENGLLTFVRDERERVLLHNVYDQYHFLVAQKFGNGDSIQYRYDVSPNQLYAENVTLTLPDGSAKTIATGNFVNQFYKDRPAAPAAKPQIGFDRMLPIVLIIISLAFLFYGVSRRLAGAHGGAVGQSGLEYLRTSDVESGPIIADHTLDSAEARAAANRSLKNYPLPSLFGLFGMLLAAHFYPPLDMNPVMGIGLALLFVPIAAHLWLSARRHLASNVALLKRMYRLQAAVLCVFAAFLLLNGWLDRYPPVQASTRVTQKNATTGRGGASYSLVVSPSWRTGRVEERLEVSGTTFSTVRRGEPIRVVVHRGALGLSWFSDVLPD
jgi:YD repeat-containing protein